MSEPQKSSDAELATTLEQMAQWIDSLGFLSALDTQQLGRDAQVLHEAATRLRTRDRKTLNLNDHVWIKLRPKGLEILSRDPFQERIHAHRQTTPEGWTRWQLWEVMEAFGPAIHLGTVDLPFDTEIRLEEPA